MPKTALLSLKGEKIKDIKLEDNVWKIEPNDQEIYESIVLYTGSRRQGTAKTKTRSEVSGGGRKPWRQKGTGNARQGSIRAPQWTGGGIVFGPTPRSYTKKMNRKERRLALKSALSYKVNDLVAVDKLDIKSGKTKDMIKLLETLKLSGKVLMVVAELTDTLILASRNVQSVKLVLANELNTYDILDCDKMLITEDAIKYIEEVLK